MASLIGIVVGPTPICAAPLEFTGVNLSGAEFGVSNNNVHLPGIFGTDYFYPTAAEVNYYVGKGMNTFRLPFRWERLQRSLNSALDPTELGRMDTFVNAATAKGAYTIIDPHNFERYNPAASNFQSSAQGLVGSSVPDSAFADFWSRIATQYKSNSHVIFNLMNEPNTVPEAQLVASENAAIVAIRATGATNLILVPGNDYTGAWTWTSGANNTGMLGIVDSGNNFAYDVHQYLDSNGSGGSTQIGTNQNPNDATIGVSRLTSMTQWLHDNHQKAFLGEFAVGNSTIGTGATQVGDEAINNMLTLMEQNSDVWLGWNWWGGGPNWGNYMFSIEPTGLGTGSQADRAVMSALQATDASQTHPHVAHTLTGDYDNNGLVDANDYTVWQNSFGQTGAGLAADANLNGIVDAGDYTIWRDHMQVSGAGALGGGTVPEPCSYSLAILGAACLGLARRRGAACSSAD
ncbi:MAG TPA: cellulase family glycosylhydrolase [Lacipirellulaceae bacterium]